MQKIIILFVMMMAVNGFAADKIEINNILVIKSERVLYLRNNNDIMKKYKISLGKQPIGAKEREGDMKTPEGNYFIEWHNPNSKFHLSLKISYPNDEQKEQAKIKGYSAGDFIMIHGYPNYTWDFAFDFIHKSSDWTDGCIAVNNEEIEEIYKLVKDGTPITILP